MEHGAFYIIESLGILPVQDPDGNKVISEVIFGPGKRKYRYCKVDFLFSKMLLTDL
jgi:hypothetical protein